MQVRRDDISVSIDDKNILNVYEPTPVEPLQDVEAAVLDALRNPIGTRPLGQLARGKKNVALVVDTWHRATPAFQLLPPIISELRDNGVRKEHIKLVMAHGIHSPVSSDITRIKLGRFYDEYEVVEHQRYCHPKFGFNDKRFGQGYQLSFVGFSTFGTPIFVNSAVVEADLKIALSSIHPNVFGFTGGSKMIMPGVGGYESININHNLGLAAEPWMCRTDCPARDEMEQVARMIGLDMSVDILYTKAQGGANTAIEQSLPGVKVTHVFAGDPIASHRQGVKTYMEVYKPATLGQQADITLSLNPPGLNFFSNETSIVVAGMATKPGGSVVLLSECSHGFFHAGCPNLTTCQSYVLNDNSPEEVAMDIASGAIPGWNGMNLYWMARAKQRVRQFFWVIEQRKGTPLELTAKNVETMGYTPELDVKRALGKAFELQGDNATVNVLNPGTLPVVGTANEGRYLGPLTQPLSQTAVAA